MRIPDDQISRSRASSVSSDDGARQEADKSPIARQLSGVTTEVETGTTWCDSEIEAEPKPKPKPEKGLVFRMRTYLGLVSGHKVPYAPKPAVVEPVTPEKTRSSDSQAQNPPAMEPQDVAAETAVKEIAVEETAEDVGATAEPHAEPLGYTELVLNEAELEAELDGYLYQEETNGIVDSEPTSNGDAQTPWQREMDAALAKPISDQNALDEMEAKLELLAANDGLEGLDSLAADGEIAIQDAARKRLAPNSPPADPASGAATGASGGPAAAEQAAPSSAVENSTCASQFGEEALKTLFAQGDQDKAKNLSALYAKSNNAYAKLTVLEFAETFTVSLHKIRDDAGLSKEEKNSLEKKLHSLAEKYTSLIENEGLDKESAFGAFYLGHKDQRDKRLSLEGDLVKLSGGENAKGRKALRDVLIKNTVRPFIDARLAEMFGGKPSGYTTSLTAEMLDARAQEALDKIGDAAEKYAQNHGASVRGLAFGFSLVTLWPELLRKILDDETPAAAQAQNPAAAPDENGDPSQPFLPPASAGGPSNPTPAGSPEAAMPNEHGSGAGGGTVINIGSIHIDKRSNYNNGNGNNNSNSEIIFGRDGAMGPEDDGSDVSSESGSSDLTKANLVEHNRRLAAGDQRFAGGRIALPTISQTTESDSETSESDVDSEEGEGRNSIGEDFSAQRGNALQSPSWSGDEVDSGIFARGIGDRSDQRESVAGYLNEADDGNASSASSGYDSDAEQGKVASRHKTSARSPLTTGSFTLKSKFLPFAQG